MTIACNEHLFFKTAAIYGGIAGGIVLLILVAVVVVFVLLRHCRQGNVGGGAVEKNDKPEEERNDKPASKLI